jgi:hypothetical protein
MNEMLWKVLIPVIATGILGWGAWATVSMTSALPESKFEVHEKELANHKERNEDQFDAVQRQLVDKLDEIQKTILDLHKGD